MVVRRPVKSECGGSSPSSPAYPPSREVAFPALIKKIEIKSLVSGDKSGEIRLWFRPDDDTLDQLNRLHRADEEVMVALVPIANNEKYREISKRKQRKAKGDEV